MDSANAASAGSRRRSSSLGQRLLTAAIGVPVLAGLIWFSYWTTALLVMVAVAISLNELYQALAQGGFRPRSAVGFVCALLLCLAATLRPLLLFDLSGLTLAMALCLSLVAELARRDREGALLAWSLTFACTCYVSWLFSHFILLRALELPALTGGWLAVWRISPGAAWVFAVLAITWLQDTGAYFVGRAVGRHKMAPYLSPNKTWEGVVGGVLTAVLIALLLVPLLGLPLNYAQAAVLGVVGGVLGPLGDLAESFIKRQLGVKDLGSLLPGHGGILDRSDSVIFTAPLLYYLILLFIR